MNSGKAIKYLAPFTIVLIIAIFIYNVATHGSIQHPGKSSYRTNCADCHGDEGEGIKSLVPPLASSDFAQTHFDSIPCWLKNGISHKIKVNGINYDQPMYGLGMDEIQIANVMNYLSKEFFKSDREINSIKVKKMLEGCK